MKKLGALVLACVLIISGAALHLRRTFEPDITLCTWPYNHQIAFTVTCDDISAGYPLEYLEEIQAILETHSIRATFFVIPYHGEWDLLTDSPPLVEKLQEIQAYGHEIGLHGYAHYENEFVCSPEEQRLLLEKALPILKEAHLTVKGFRAPCLQATDETQSVLKAYNFVYDSSVFGESENPSFEGDLPEVPSGYEYTWYITEEELSDNLAKAQQDFSTKYQEGSVFSLVTHMKAVNEGEGIHFLEDFLSFVTTQDVWNPTVLQLVEWDMRLQEVTWESRKTLTGGEITFCTIPEGLVVRICLPPHYAVKDLPQGVTMTSFTEGQSRGIELTFTQQCENVVIPFVLTYTDDLNNELLIVCSPSHAGTDRDDATCLKTLLASWEIPHRVVTASSLSRDIVGNSSIILVDKTFLERSLTTQEKWLLYSLKNRIIIFSGFNFGFPELFRSPRTKDLDYVALPLRTPGFPLEGGRNLGYYTVRILKGRSTYIMFEPLRDDTTQELYYNLLVRSLVICNMPVRKPFFSLEIDDCAMYKIHTRQNHVLVADIQAYQNSLDLAHSHGLNPVYGFTTSYFFYNPDIKEIFTLLKKNNVLVANHGYRHFLGFIDPGVLAREIFQANADIEALWGEPPTIILVPCHKMHQDAMIDALEGSPIQAVGAEDKGYTFGVFEGILFYQRTSLQLHSAAVDDAPEFPCICLYSRSFPPFFYGVTHIFNYVEKESAYQYIDDALHYLTVTGYTPSDTMTMVEEDFFWGVVDLKSFKKGEKLIIEFSGLEHLPPREYTVHFMIYGSCPFTITADTYSVESYTEPTDTATSVTVILKPESDGGKGELHPLQKILFR
jgi:predicted deacetylase